MKNREKKQARTGSAFLVISMLFILGTGTESAGYEVGHRRSIYVPVLFMTCERPADARLSVSSGQQESRVGERVGQFSCPIATKADREKEMGVRLDARIAEAGASIRRGREFCSKRATRSLGEQVQQED